MTGADWIFAIVLVGWLVGVGLWAHAFSAWLNSSYMPDYVRVALSMFAERVAVVLAITVVAWPIVIPALVVMTKVQTRRKKGG